MQTLELDIDRYHFMLKAKAVSLRLHMKASFGVIRTRKRISRGIRNLQAV